MADFAGTAITNIDANFKQQFGDFVDLVPEGFILQDKKKVKFVNRDKQPGGVYRFPVEVSREQGVTYAGPNSGAFALENPSSIVLQDAQILGSNIVLSSAIGYEELSRALSTKQAFKTEMGLRMQSSLRSHRFRREFSLIYGRAGICTFPTNSDTAPSATTRALTSSAAQFSLGTWAQALQATVEFRDSGGTIVSTGDDSYFTVTYVDSDTRVVTFTGTSTGCSDLTTALNSGAVTAYFKGSYDTGDSAGLYAIMNNATTLFNINAATYPLWKSNTVTYNGGTLTFGRVINSLAKATSFGLMEKVTVLVSPNTWTDLATDVASQRRPDGSYKSGQIDIGSESIQYYSQNGALEIVPHILVKDGDCFMVNLNDATRVGSTDVTFETPAVGYQGSNFFYQLPSNAGVGIRNFSNYGLILEHPAQAVYVTGFVNSPVNEA